MLWTRFKNRKQLGSTRQESIWLRVHMSVCNNTSYKQTKIRLKACCRFISAESRISELLGQETIPLPHPQAFSSLPCKAPTKNDKKNAGGCDDAQTREWHFYDINNFLQEWRISPPPKKKRKECEGQRLRRRALEECDLQSWNSNPMPGRQLLCHWR